MASAHTMLKRTGLNHYCGMLVAIASPADWSTPTTLCHFVEENGASTVFIVSDEARDQIQACEQWRIYDIVIPGKCVKKSEATFKFGVDGVYDVVAKFPFPTLKLADAGWPLRFHYNPIEWETLNQVELDKQVDLIGVVLRESIRYVNNRIPKLLVVLGNEDLAQ